MRSRSAPRPGGITKLLALVSALLLTNCGGMPGAQKFFSSAPVTVQVKAQDFGMHIHSPFLHGWPVVPIGFWRLWDSNVQWPQLEASPGKWDFSLLDREVTIARQQGAEPLIVFGLTPQWASARPTEPCNYGLGACAEPTNLSDWQDYINQVATRYKGRVHYYELWNEPDLKAYYTGTVESMLSLAKAAYTILKQVDPTVTVLSPAAVVQTTGTKWLTQYLAIGGGNYADIIAHHFYQFPGKPEKLVSYFADVQQVLASAGVNKPIWDTEMGWGPGSSFSSQQEMADFVARTFLLHWAFGISHVAWYAWDDHRWPTLILTEQDNSTPTAAGLAFAQMQDWGIGTTAASCTQDSNQNYACHLQRSDGSSRYAVWNPDSTGSFAVPSEWKVTRLVALSGRASAIINGQVEVGSSPVLLTQ
jgi:hypothetical protein